MIAIRARLKTNSTPTQTPTPRTSLRRHLPARPRGGKPLGILVTSASTSSKGSRVIRGGPNLKIGNDKVLVAGEARANLGSEERPDEEEYGGFYFVNVTK